MAHAESSPPRTEVDLTSLREILQRVEDAGVLDEKSMSQLSGVVDTLALVTSELEKDRSSLRRLRKWLFGPSTEKRSKVLPKVGDPPAQSGAEASRAAGAQTTPAVEVDKPEKTPPPPKPGHGRNGADDHPGAQQVEVPHPELEAGMPCPDCSGKVYPFKKPKLLVRIVGMAPLLGTVYRCQQLRCNACQKMYTAPPPAGVGTEKYDASATAMVTLLHYGTGVPFNQLEKLQQRMGIPVPASTQWDLAKAAAPKVAPVFEELVDQAAQSDVIHNDDTYGPVLELMNPKKRPKHPEIDEERTGSFTTGIVAQRAGHHVALYFTGMKHAGENLRDVLRQRKEDLGPIIQACDGLTRNEPDGIPTLVANCNAHARRKYVELADVFPAECAHLIDVFSRLYKNDAHARKEGMGAEQRLAYHQEHSRKLMEDMKDWAVQKLETRQVEPNSSLGGALRYMLKRWEKLTLFLRVAGVPLDTNICERALKKAIRYRKNSLYYRTTAGARVGDMFISLIHTAELNDADPFHYLTAVLRNHEDVEEHPERWLPWNYQVRMGELSVAN